MSHETLHAPRERLDPATVTQHQAIISLIEELEAADWYLQRADDCEDAALKAILLHHRREELEHACMLLEWLRRNDADWAGNLGTYLFKTAPITETESKAEGAPGGAPAAPATASPAGFSIGRFDADGGAGWKP